MRFGLMTRAVNALFCWPRNRRFPDEGRICGRNVRIFVLQHAPCKLPECFADRNVYVPLQCGRALHPAIEGTLGDDAGENISASNADINEMTAIWWVGRHYGEIGNPDYVGFAHYRRKLSWRGDLLADDAVLACKTLSWRTLKGFFEMFHSGEALEAFTGRFAERFGTEEDCLFRKYLNGHVFYPCNCFVMSRESFRRYHAFIDVCVEIALGLIRDGIVDRTKLDAYQKRVFGFILERMTSYWIWREKRVGRIRAVGCEIEEFDIANRTNSYR